jgi:hypothetical protein
MLQYFCKAVTELMEDIGKWENDRKTMKQRLVNLFENWYIVKFGLCNGYIVAEMFRSVEDESVTCRAILKEILGTLLSEKILSYVVIWSSFF